jgi:HJR/Mrr/RecB family endonuclease
VAQVTLRTVREMFTADRAKHFDSVVFNGHVSTTDPRTGHATRPCLVTLRTTRDAFHDLDLEHVDPEACLRGLNASVSRSPSELAPVRPVLEFDMVDSRFVESANVLSSIDQRPNLMELKPTEFEQLITNLFEKMGLETRLTQASRDGGVDCVAYDPRPILGGKVVIQAKRYKHTVGVSAVRDLFGTMQNEGASKGILVTTSGYGKASFEFAQGKPLELLSGSNLLALLAEYAGITAKIEAPEDWTDPIDDAPEVRPVSAPTQPPDEHAVRDRSNGAASTGSGTVGDPEPLQQPSPARVTESNDPLRRRAMDPLQPLVDGAPRAALLTVRVREDTHTFTGDDGNTIWCGGYAPVEDEGSFQHVDDRCSSDPRCFYCKVAGAQHYAALADPQFGRGSQIALRAEPENPHDANAVGIWDITGKQQAGHVSASLCGDIAQLLRSGVALGGLVIREFRATSSTGERIGLHVLIGPVGNLSLVVLDDDE